MLLLGACHVALEPFPFPASITSLDAFAVGTPVVSHGAHLAEHGLAQLTASLYRRLGAFDFKAGGGGGAGWEDGGGGAGREDGEGGAGRGDGGTDPFDGRGGFEECCVANRAQGRGGVAEKAVRLAMDAGYRAQVSSAITRLSPRLFKDTGAVREWEAFLRGAVALGG